MDDAVDIRAQELLQALRKGALVALGRAISHVESGGDVALALLDLIHAESGDAARIGVTGPPGTGKSTLVSSLAEAMRADNSEAALAVVAIDPSSPFTGGALLGDRFRMHAISDDPKVFIRSMASRGALGGLSEATEAACDVLEAADYANIIIETVGVGQSEVDIASACDTTVLVLNPESGDTIQALKAGLMEIADVLVVNKADHPRTQRFLTDLNAALELKTHASRGGKVWQVPVVTTIATQGQGTRELLDAVNRHQAYLRDHGLLAEVREERLRRRLKQLWIALIHNQALETPALAATFERVLVDVLSQQCSLYRAASELARETLSHHDHAARFSEETLGQAIAADRHPEASDFTPPRDDGRERETRTHLKDLGPQSS